MKSFICLILLNICMIPFGIGQIPEEGLIAYYPFNGNANDRSGNCIHGTVYNAKLTSDRFGFANAAYHFNGTLNQYIEIVNPPFDLPVFSYSLWSLPETLPNPGGFEATLSIGGTNYRDQLVNIRFEGWGSTSYNIDETHQVMYSPKKAKLNRWTHMVMTRSKNRVKFYENGKLVDDQVIPNSLPALYSDNLTTTFGIRHDFTHPFAGKIDDIRIYDRAITDEEVDILYKEHICFESILVTDTLLIEADLESFFPVEFNIHLKVYPNPTLSHLIIDISNYTELNNYSLELINPAGTQIFQSEIDEQIYDLDMSKWIGSGIYFLYLYDPDGNIVDVKKILLQ